MKRITTITIILTLAVTLLTINGCKKGGVNFFSIEDDKNFGAQMEAEILNNPAQYPLLSETAYPQAYAYLYRMRDSILAKGNLQYKNDFAWKLYIIQDDNVLNAFCTPGGYIYVYTGLIKYLDNASALAGVMGHEMAHADLRHSTQQLTQQYGLSLLLAVVAGTTNAGQIAEIAAGLTGLAFSRDHEKAADANSVSYLCGTHYRADGAADFFQKIVDEGNPQPPAFLSTHPNPDNRIQNIKDKSAELQCSNTPSTQIEITDYQSFKALLP